MHWHEHAAAQRMCSGTCLALRSMPTTEVHAPLLEWSSQLWLAFFIENAILPLVFAYVFVVPYVTWSGVRYRKQRGKVVAVQHVTDATAQHVDQGTVAALACPEVLDAMLQPDASRVVRRPPAAEKDSNCAAVPDRQLPLEPAQVQPAAAAGFEAERLVAG